MDINEYQIYVISFNKCESKACSLSCKCILCSQLKSFKSFKLYVLSTYNGEAHC